MAHDTPKGTPNFDSGLVWIIGIVSVILFFVIIVGIEAGFRFAWSHEVYTKQYQPPYTALVELEQAQTEMITAVRWVDRDKRIAAIPIAQAIDQYVAGQQSR